MREAIARAVKQIEQGWWGIPIAYFGLIFAIYPFIWTYIEPTPIEHKITLPEYVMSRWFWHILLTSFGAAHLTIVICMILAKKFTTNKHSTQSILPTPTPEKPVAVSNNNKAEIKLAEAENKLAGYESLEKEILGLLANGMERNFEWLCANVEGPSNRRGIALALASLTESGKILGNDGRFKYARSVVKNKE